ncbi:hypothetical protein ACJIZ3_003780 [Penstemon smallii]|uniref:Uncharacterized protein n=1 Tax=Penstemon smallii TaxID=265156 RepID=A0ABD3S074_9LAMI
MSGSKRRERAKYISKCHDHKLDKQLNPYNDNTTTTMKTTINTSSSSLILPPNPKTFFPQKVHNNSSIKLPRTPAPRILKCSKNGSENGSGGLKDVLSGMVDERVEQLLNKEENRDLLDGLEKASRRVEMAKRELAEIEKQEKEAKVMRDYINQLESRASEIAECQKEITEARLMVEEAERSLKDRGINDLTESKSEVMSKDEERLESVKAASIAAVIGTIAELPISLTRVNSNSELILPLAITFISCALFGVTFRYAIRRDLDNFQLKSGTSAAFGFVKACS